MSSEHGGQQALAAVLDQQEWQRDGVARSASMGVEQRGHRASITSFGCVVESGDSVMGKGHLIY